MSLLTRALSPVRRGSRVPDSEPEASGRQRALAMSEPDVPEWVGTDADPVWTRVRSEVAQFASMREVRRTAQGCQVAAAQLVDQARQSGPVGQAATGALHSLALDLQQECHRLTTPRSEPGRRGRAGIGGHPTLLDWLRSPVGSGGPAVGDMVRMRDTHRITMAVRLFGAFGAALLLAAARPWPALAMLLGTVTASGIVRYRTNAEAAVTFRARYFSCLCGHAGDLLVLAGATIWLLRAGQPGLAVLPALTGMIFLFGTATRTGALQVGVSVPRLRMERVFRVAGLTLGITGAALGVPGAFALTLAVAVAYVIWEISRAFGLVWTTGVTEFAWTTATREGFVTEALSAPAPDWPHDPFACVEACGPPREP